jgi:hypothetical protein
MRHVGRLLVLVGAVACAVLVAPAPAARACSCASAPSEPPLAFEGVVLRSLPALHATPVFRFRVLRAERGAEPNSEVDVALSVPVKTAGGISASSCDLSSVPLQAGARYRVTAYIGEPNGERHFYATQCGGSLELISGRRSDVASPRATQDEDGRRWLPLVVAGTAAAAAAATAAIVVGRRRRTPRDAGLEPPSPG